MKDNDITNISDLLLIYFTLDVDLYARHRALWKGILSWVERWNRSQTDLMARSSLYKAGQLLHKTGISKFRYKLTKSFTKQST